MTEAGGTLSIEARPSNGTTSDRRTSNSLPVLDFALRQVSNVTAAGNDSVNALAALDNKLFVLGDGVYRYDPDGDNYLRLTNINTSGDDHAMLPQVYRGKLYFMANSLNTGKRKLYSWDNSATGTLHRISDTRPGGDDYVLTDPFKGYAIANDKLHVMLKNASNQYKLFQYDDAIGTNLVQVSDTSAGASDDVFANSQEKMEVFDSKVVFRGRIPAGHCKLMWYDGATVTQVTNRNPATCDDPGNFVTGPDGDLYFSMDTGSEGPGILYKWSRKYARNRHSRPFGRDAP
jgi:hypothetical protein